MARVAAAQPARSQASPPRRITARTARSQAVHKDGSLAVNTTRTNVSAPRNGSRPVNPKAARPRSDRLGQSNNETRRPPTTTARGVRSATATTTTATTTGDSFQKGKNGARSTAKKATGSNITKPRVPSRLDQPTAASRARAVNAKTMVKSGLRTTATSNDSSLITNEDENEDEDDDEDELARPGVTTHRKPTVPTRVPAAATRPTAASKQRAKATISKAKALQVSNAQPKRNVTRPARSAGANGKKNVDSAATRNAKLTDLSASKIAAKRGVGVTSSSSKTAAPAKNVTFGDVPNKVGQNHSQHQQRQDGKGVSATQAVQSNRVARVIREAPNRSPDHVDDVREYDNKTAQDGQPREDGEDVTDVIDEDDDTMEADHSNDYEGTRKRQSTSQGILASPAKRILPENLPKPKLHAVPKSYTNDDNWFTFASDQKKPVLLSPACRPPPQPVAAAMPSTSRTKRSPLLTLRDFASEDDDTEQFNLSPLKKAPLKHNFTGALNVDIPEPTLHGDMKFLRSPAKKSVARSLFGPVHPHHDDEPIALKPNSPLKRSPRKVHVQRPIYSGADTMTLNRSRLFGSPAKKCSVDIFQQAPRLDLDAVAPKNSPPLEDDDLPDEVQVPSMKQSPAVDVGYQGDEGNNEDRTVDDQGIFNIFSSPKKHDEEKADVPTHQTTENDEGQVNADIDFGGTMEADKEVELDIDANGGDSQQQATQEDDQPNISLSGNEVDGIDGDDKHELAHEVPPENPVEGNQEPLQVEQVPQEPLEAANEYNLVNEEIVNNTMPGAFEQPSSPAANEPQSQDHQESPLLREISNGSPLDHEEVHSSNVDDPMDMVPENTGEENLPQANSEEASKQQQSTAIDDYVIDWEDDESEQSLNPPIQEPRELEPDHGAEAEIRYPSLPSPAPHTSAAIRDRQFYGTDDTDATEDEYEGSDVDETTIHVNPKDGQGLDMTGLTQQLSEWHGDETQVEQPPSAASTHRSTDNRPEFPMRKVNARKSADPRMMTDLRITEEETFAGDLSTKYHQRKKSRLSLPVMKEFSLHRSPVPSATRTPNHGHSSPQNTPLSIKPSRFSSLSGSVERMRHQSTPVRGPFSPKPRASMSLHNEDKENLQPDQHTSPSSRSPRPLSMSMTPTRLSAQGTPRVIHTICKVPLRMDDGDDDDTGLIVPRKRSRHLSLTPAKPVHFKSQPAAAAEGNKGVRVPLKPCDDNRSVREENASPVKEQSTPKRLRSKSPRRASGVSKPPGILQDVVVFTDVHTSEGADASGIFIEVLEKMGARCVRSWNWNPRASMSGTIVDDVEISCRESKIGITHVVYKDGGVKTLGKVRQAGGLVKCVGVAWVLDCEREGRRLNEDDYAVDTSQVPRGGLKRRKSMEPRRLSNVNGKLVRFGDSGSFSDKRSDETKDTGDGLPTLTPSPANYRRRRSSRRDSMEWVKMQAGDSRTATAEEEVEGLEVIRTPNRRQSEATYGDELEEDDDFETPTSGFDLDLNVAPSPFTPYDPLAFKSRLVQQTCPPKQTHARLFEDSPEPEANAFQLRLEAARRKSLVWKPKVGSPLAR